MLENMLIHPLSTTELEGNWFKMSLYGWEYIAKNMDTSTVAHLYRPKVDPHGLIQKLAVQTV